MLPDRQQLNINVVITDDEVPCDNYK